MAENSFTPENINRVDIEKADDVFYWTRKFKCSKNELIKAVEIVGDSAKKVNDYINDGKNKKKK
jgi:hypothetical protein